MSNLRFSYRKNKQRGYYKNYSIYNSTLYDTSYNHNSNITNFNKLSYYSNNNHYILHSNSRYIRCDSIKTRVHLDIVCKTSILKTLQDYAYQCEYRDNLFKVPYMHIRTASLRKSITNPSEVINYYYR